MSWDRSEPSQASWANDGDESRSIHGRLSKSDAMRGGKGHFSEEGWRRRRGDREIARGMLDDPLIELHGVGDLDI